MDSKTRQQLKDQDKFVMATENGVAWANENRSSVIKWSVTLVVVVMVIVVGFAVYNHRVLKAREAFGEAMAIYQTPVSTPGQPAEPGVKTYPDTKSRATAANAAFKSVADQYGMTEPGRNAQYFVGVTYLEMGQNGTAEETLRKVASGWDGDTAALAKQALAQYLAQSGREAEAVPLFEELGKGHAVTVSPFEAKLELAELYTAEGRQADANKLYAEIKDKDKDPKGQPGTAAEIAGQKLSAKK